MKSLSDPGIKGKNLEALMESLLGFTLPVHDLLDLLRAGAAARDLSARNWQCRILSRLPDGAPQRLRIERAAPNALQVTLFIDEAH